MIKKSTPRSEFVCLVHSLLARKEQEPHYPTLAPQSLSNAGLITVKSQIIFKLTVTQNNLQSLVKFLKVLGVRKMDKGVRTVPFKSENNQVI